MPNYKIVLDIGHGLNTKGKGVNGLKEFAFNEAVVKYAMEFAKLNKIEVALTQPFDANEKLSAERLLVMNQPGIDLVFSVHADASLNIDSRGHWVFYWHEKTQSKLLAELWEINADSVMSNPCRGIIESELNSWTNFWVTRESHPPTILIEHAFMTNAQDLILLLSETFRKNCAKAIIKTACDYLKIQFKEGEDMLSDVNGHWAQKFIENIIENKIMSGYPDGTFKPNQPLTRAEFAAVLDTILKKESWYKGE